MYASLIDVLIDHVTIPTVSIALLSEASIVNRPEPPPLELPAELPELPPAPLPALPVVPALEPAPPATLPPAPADAPAPSSSPSDELQPSCSAANAPNAASAAKCSFRHDLSCFVKREVQPMRGMYPSWQAPGVSI